MGLDRERLHFLFQSEEGRIDRAEWRRGVLMLAAILLPMTLLWVFARPYIVHDLAKTPFFDWRVFFAYAYSLIFAFALIFIAVSYVNLSAKRFRDLGFRGPLGLAALVPLVALLDGAARFTPLITPASFVLAPDWLAYVFDALFAAAALWTGWTLGVRGD